MSIAVDLPLAMRHKGCNMNPDRVQTDVAHIIRKLLVPWLRFLNVKQKETTSSKRSNGSPSRKSVMLIWHKYCRTTKVKWYLEIIAMPERNDEVAYCQRSKLTGHPLHTPYHLLPWRAIFVK